MEKINWRKVIVWSLVGIGTIRLFLPMIIQTIIEPKIKTYQPIAFVRELNEIEKQKLYLLESVKYNYAKFRLFDKIIILESQWKPTAIGDSGKAYGLAQFHHLTFDQFKIMAGMPNLEYENSYDQITLLVWAVENNFEEHWTTYQKAKYETKYTKKI